MLCDKKPIMVFLKAPSEEKKRDTHPDSFVKTDEKTKEKVKPDNDPILCRQCGLWVTCQSDKIEKDGAHHHTFANPLGMVFEIGCFENAMGCAYVGEPSDDFSWFKGFFWQAVLCRKCMVHLGWLFTSFSGGSHFYGLILDRLIEMKD